MVTAKEVTGVKKNVSWPKNLTYKAVYRPDMDRMVEALKIVLEMPMPKEEKRAVENRQ